MEELHDPGVVGGEPEEGCDVAPDVALGDGAVDVGEHELLLLRPEEHREVHHLAQLLAHVPPGVVPRLQVQFLPRNKEYLNQYI